MNNEKYRRMIGRAKALLAIAEDPAASENEAATAWAQAQKLMSRYAIEDWQLHQQERRNDPIVKHGIDLGKDPMNFQKAVLASYVAQGNRARTYFEEYMSGNGRRMVRRIIFYGTEQDCRQAEMIWTSMETYRASHWRPAARLRHGKANARWRNGYYMGFQDRIQARYAQLRHDPSPAGPASQAGTELVKVRDAQLEEFERTLNLMPASRPRIRFSPAAQEEGSRAADSMPLGLDELHNPQRIQNRREQP